jgi:hypothetical protein
VGRWPSPVRQGAVATASRLAALICEFSRVAPLWPRTVAGVACPEWGGIVSDGVVALTGQIGRGSYRVSVRRPRLRILTCSPDVARHICLWGVPGIGLDSVGSGGGPDRSDRAR